MQEKAITFSQQLQERLVTIEKRDWELWVLALSMVGILAVGYFLVIFPAVFLNQRTIFLQANVSSTLAVGMLSLVLLFLAYMVRKHLHIRELRAESMIDALNFQVAHSQSLIDPLTQAFNRSTLEEILTREIKRVQRKQTTMVFLYIDINDFKKVNTRFGHLSGDLVLTNFGAILKNCVRGSDYIIRMGGDEFLLALVDTDEPGAAIVKQRINQQTAKWNDTSPLKGYALSVSIGLQVYDGNRTVDEILADADAKMYSEKRSRG